MNYCLGNKIQQKCKKEPLAKQAALVYNLRREVDRTRVPICPQ